MSNLKYRTVGDDLLLIDIHASLIVDILPSVLLDPTAAPAVSNDEGTLWPTN